MKKTNYKRSIKIGNRSIIKSINIKIADVSLGNWKVVPPTFPAETRPSVLERTKLRHMLQDQTTNLPTEV